MLTEKWCREYTENEFYKIFDCGVKVRRATIKEDDGAERNTVFYEPYIKVKNKDYWRVNTNDFIRLLMKHYKLEEFNVEKDKQEKMIFDFLLWYCDSFARYKSESEIPDNPVTVCLEDCYLWYINDVEIEILVAADPDDSNAKFCLTDSEKKEIADRLYNDVKALLMG